MHKRQKLRRIKKPFFSCWMNHIIFKTSAGWIRSIDAYFLFNLNKNTQFHKKCVCFYFHYCLWRNILYWKLIKWLHQKQKRKAQSQRHQLRRGPGCDAPWQNSARLSWSIRCTDFVAERLSRHPRPKSQRRLLQRNERLVRKSNYYNVWKNVFSFSILRNVLGY